MRVLSTVQRKKKKTALAVGPAVVPQVATTADRSYQGVHVGKMDESIKRFRAHNLLKRYGGLWGSNYYYSWLGISYCSILIMQVIVFFILHSPRQLVCLLLLLYMMLPPTALLMALLLVPSILKPTKGRLVEVHTCRWRRMHR